MEDKTIKKEIEIQETKTVSYSLKEVEDTILEFQNQLDNAQKGLDYWGLIKNQLENN